MSDIEHDAKTKPELSSSVSFSLFLAIFIWVSFFALLLWFSGVISTGDPYWFSVPEGWAARRSHSELTTAILTMLGGAVAVSYLVIKFRERTSLEKQEQRDQQERVAAAFRTAIEQLGHDKPVVRMAGVHALVDMNDRYGGEYKQRVVDVLCGYLRSDRGDDNAVEASILRAIHERTLRLDREHGTLFSRRTLSDIQPWHGCFFDFRNVHLGEPLDLSSTAFEKTIDFEGSTLMRVDFSYAIFNQKANFNGVTLRGEAMFSSAAFCEKALFAAATFKGPTTFFDVTFRKETTYAAAVFESSVKFDNTTFELIANFKLGKFLKSARFYKVTFAESAVFDGAVFHQGANFELADFRGLVNFRGLPKPVSLKFKNAKFNRAYRERNAFENNMEVENGIPSGSVWS